MSGGFRRYLSSPLVMFIALACFGMSGVEAQTVSFSRDVKPILAKRCFACHGPDEAESGLSLDSFDGAVAEADSGEFAIVPGDPETSELLLRIASDDEDLRMPPEGDPLTPSEIKTIRQWISDGAAYEKHWAFVAPAFQAPPQVKAKDWVANPIDAFVLAQLEAAGLRPAPPADKRVLARRVYFDVTGLPPTQAELQAFLTDDAPDAYERLVDKLLASPRYGEKWARHWLDVVRYAETNSFERDAAKPFIWKYRDYVIRSLNDDKPYDQFVREQLAGDELEKVTPDTIAATGYYRLGTWDDEPADLEQAKFDDLDNILSTTGQAFLGLTIGCARCHDHKIDPFPQTDYYGMLAFFADVTPYAMPHKREAKHHSLWDLSPPDEIAVRAGLENQLDGPRWKKHAMEQAAIAKMSDVDQRRSETHERQAVLDENLTDVLTAEENKTYAGYVQKLKGLRKKISKLPKQELIMALAKCDPRPARMHVMMRGNAHSPGDPVDPRYPELCGDEPPVIPESAEGARSAGRRRVLADWIIKSDNMLSSRVIANRLWQHHFGRGIVRSANNFGQLGTPPTHPELLDWLALWLVDQEWHLKPLHRLMLTSNTYRQSSTASPEALAADPTNNLFWRFNMRRLTAEEIRDSVLYTSGQLNDEMYGPSIYPKLSQEVLLTQSRPGLGWGKYNPKQASRRSVYIHIKRSLIPPELSAFDFPETDTSCEARFNTTQAAQALNLMHGEFLQRQSKHLAERIVTEHADADLSGRVGHVIRLALQREPDETTVKDGLELIETFQTKHNLSTDEAFRQYCLLVLNLNEFVFLD